MKMFFLLVGFLTILINSPLYACDIVNKRNVQIDGHKGVGGNCSNNGEKIECYELGQYSGGFRCDGPGGNSSGPNLKDLIYAVCGCSLEDQDRIEEQMNQELK